jgi:hypothetical protein
MQLRHINTSAPSNRRALLTLAQTLRSITASQSLPSLLRLSLLTSTPLACRSFKGVIMKTTLLDLLAAVLIGLALCALLLHALDALFL